MSSSYPASLDALSTAKVDATLTGSGDHAGHHNDLADAINKIEAELGISPSSTYTDLVSRLSAGIDTDNRRLTELMRTLGAGGLPIAWTVPPADVSAATDMVVTAQRLAGAAFCVNQPCTASSVSVHCAVAGTSFRNYTGAALYQMNSSGDWTFLQDTGANDTTLLASTGYNTKALAGNVPLTDGVVYVAALVSDWTGTQPQIAGVANARVINMGQATSVMRCAARSTVTTRQNANILNANLGPITNLPFIAVNGTVP